MSTYKHNYVILSIFSWLNNYLITLILNLQHIQLTIEYKIIYSDPNVFNQLILQYIIGYIAYNIIKKKKKIMFLTNFSQYCYNIFQLIHYLYKHKLSIKLRFINTPKDRF